MKRIYKKDTVEDSTSLAASLGFRGPYKNSCVSVMSSKCPYLRVFNDSDQLCTSYQSW